MTTNNPTVQTLGYAGLIPFIAFALLLWRPTLAPEMVARIASSLGENLVYHGFLGYSAVILSFLGGIFWGQALQMGGDPRASKLLIVSNLFTLIAWFALLMASPVFALVLLVFGYLTLLALEWRLSAQHPHLPQWSLTSYLPMRIVLTTVVVLLHLLVMVHFIEHAG